MAIDSAAKRAAAAHVKKPGKGVTPGTLGTALGRFAAGWNYGADFVPPPAGGGELEPLRLGQGVEQFPTLGNMWG